MFHCILVATGGSPWSQNAVETAVRLAASENAELVMVHILEDDPQYQPQDLLSADPQLRTQMEETGKQILAQAAQRAAQAQVRYQTVFHWGGIPAQSVRVAAHTRS